MKKKVTLLASLAMCLTIGSVYASWAYATSDVAETKHESVVALSQVTGSSGPKGTISVTGGRIIIDDKNSDFIADMQYNPLYIEFARSVNSDIQSITMQMTITVTSGTYGVQEQNGMVYYNILQIKDTLDATPVSTGGEGANKVTVTEYVVTSEAFNLTNSSTAQWTIEANAFGGYFTFFEKNALSLPTKADYDAFNAALESVTVEISVTEAPASN
jgi:uncharacterized protein involved in outer membrane biogenesis